MKVENFFAFYTLEVLVIVKVAVVSPHVAGTFHNESRANSGKGQKRAVYRIQRDAREQTFDVIPDHFRRWMLL
jgi:hypothetical protein